ncbi:MAG TPA: chemotaxis protein CheW [Gemmatimonadales bacterium]|nr:chemotaxis protein CheW [Gemmatimonadales bacterium]
MSLARGPGAAEHGSAREFLLVRAGRRRVGLPLEHLVEVLETGPCHPVPSREPAVRGVANVRGRLLPVLHLGALLDGGPCPPGQGEACVVVAVGGRRVCLEVDDAESVVREALLPVPPEAGMPWAAALARLPEGLVPLLDLPAVGARLIDTGTES